MRELLETCFREALDATAPGALVRSHLPAEKPSLILAVGKAALPMLAAARSLHPEVPYVATPPDYVKPPAGVTVEPGSHPVPDERSRRAAEAALAAAARLGPDDLLLLLVSGGGSALWSAPDGIELEDKRRVTRALLRAGADIHELNSVRKHLSRIKGGRLAASTRARVVALLLSDVPGDDPSTIASGPTVPDPTTYADALEVLRRHGVDDPVVRERLERGARGELPETPKPDDAITERIENRVIGSNRLALEAMGAALERRGHRAVILSDRFEGEAAELARFHAGLVHSIRDHRAPFAPPVVLLSGGEATVTVRGDGAGGRNQEFALALLHALRERGAWALSAGTDGIDGNSDAAGAIIAPDSWRRALERGLDPAAYLERNDSNGFFRATGEVLVTGPTQNNLNDVRAVVVGAEAR